MEDDNVSLDISEGSANEEQLEHVKKKKPGIIYLSTLPPYMNISKLRQLLGKFGEIGRSYLVPKIDKNKKTKRKVKKNLPPLHYEEGWIEFKSKKVAKTVAASLNNTVIMDKNRKYRDYIWNIKYLPRFKWAHLGERLAYERAVRKEKIRAEISQAKRETDMYGFNIALSKRLERNRKRREMYKEKKKVEKQAKENQEGSSAKRMLTDEEILAKKTDYVVEHEDRSKFLKQLFAR